MLAETLKAVNKINSVANMGMLDISILNADKVKDKESFLNADYVVTEKFDGTKLTLWRNGNEWNSDYRMNWVLAYKNQVLLPEEFESTNIHKTKKHSLGISQYALVFKHLEKVHNATKTIPINTEFFIEFIQNKLTTTRDYSKKHDLFLIAWTPSKAEISGGIIKTSPIGFFQTGLADYAKILEISIPPVVFEGSFKSTSTIEKGIKNKKLKKTFDDLKKEFNDKPYETVKAIFLNFESSLGGKTEGVVLENRNGEFFKFVQSDQYDKSARFARKEKFISDALTEQEYWTNIDNVSENIISAIDIGDYSVMLQSFNKVINSMSDDRIIELFGSKFRELTHG